MCEYIEDAADEAAYWIATVAFCVVGSIALIGLSIFRPDQMRQKRVQMYEHHANRGA